VTAIKAVFPDAEIKRCAFHWGQAVMRKVANLGLKTSYNENKGGLFCGDKGTTYLNVLR
jgi:transposase-like protein